MPLRSGRVVNAVSSVPVNAILTFVEVFMAKSAIVVAIEGLGTNMLGSYGGPWSQTNAVDSFAARGIVADQFWLDHDQNRSLYRSLLYGWHACEAPERLGSSLLHLLHARGIESHLVHDRVEGLEDAKEQFSTSFELSTSEKDHELSTENWDASCMADCFATALSLWADADASSLLWIHSKGWNGPWDAPYDYRAALGGEEDPPAPRGTERPESWFDSSSDPDLLFGWTQAAAAQARLLDQAWEWVDAAIEQRGMGDDCLVLLMGLGGYPLGEHGFVGPRLSAPYAERMHSPLILRFGKQRMLGDRLRVPTHPMDLWRTLLEWFEIDVSALVGEPIRRLSRPIRELYEGDVSPDGNNASPHLAVSSGGVALRVGHWCAVWKGDSLLEEQQEMPTSSGSQVATSALFDRGPVELFLHPEDRWQQNDVANRAHDVVQCLNEYRDAYLRWIRNSNVSEPIPAAPELILEQPL